MIDAIAQATIAVCSPLAAWLSQDSRTHWRRWACIAGLVAQPAWYWTVIEHAQWGLLVVCPIYTWAWLRGFAAHWWRQ